MSRSQSVNVGERGYQTFEHARRIPCIIPVREQRNKMSVRVSVNGTCNAARSGQVKERTVLFGTPQAVF